MSAADYIVIAIIAAALACAVIYMIRAKKRGRGCCGSCNGCSCGSSCPHRGKPDEKRKK